MLTNIRPSGLGILSMAYRRWESAIFLYLEDLENGKTHANYDTRGVGVDAQYALWSDGNKVPNYTDPRQAVIHSMNQLMFVTGLQVAANMKTSHYESLTDPGAPIHTTTLGRLQGHHNVFHSDYYFFAAAAIGETSVQ